MISIIHLFYLEVLDLRNRGKHFSLSERFFFIQEKMITLIRMKLHFDWWLICFLFLVYFNFSINSKKEIFIAIL